LYDETMIWMLRLRMKENNRNRWRTHIAPSVFEYKQVRILLKQRSKGKLCCYSVIVLQAANWNWVSRDAFKWMLQNPIAVGDKILIKFVEDFDHSICRGFRNSFKVCKITSNMSALLFGADWAAHMVKQTFFNALVNEWADVFKSTTSLNLDSKNVFSATAFAIKMLTSKNGVKPI